MSFITHTLGHCVGNQRCREARSDLCDEDCKSSQAQVYLSQGCPEQWEGELEDGRSVYVRERHGEVRIEIDGEVTHKEAGHDALAVLESYLDCSELEL